MTAQTPITPAQPVTPQPSPQIPQYPTVPASPYVAYHQTNAWPKAPVTTPAIESQIQSGSGASLSPLIFRFGIGVAILGLLGALWYVWSHWNFITVDNQIFGKSVAVSNITIGYPGGGYLVIQVNSGLPDGRRVAVSSYLAPGVYTDVGIEYQKERLQDVTIEPGDMLYAILYGDTYGDKILNDKDRMLKGVFGNVLIKRFRVQ